MSLIVRLFDMCNVNIVLLLSTYSSAIKYSQRLEFSFNCFILYWMHVEETICTKF